MLRLPLLSFLIHSIKVQHMTYFNHVYIKHKSLLPSENSTEVGTCFAASEYKMYASLLLSYHIASLNKYYGQGEIRTPPASARLLDSGRYFHSATGVLEVSSATFMVRLRLRLTMLIAYFCCSRVYSRCPVCRWQGLAFDSHAVCQTVCPLV